MKRALVLAGGGARGPYQAGVLQYLWERKWIPDIICGSSVGALNAVLADRFWQPAFREGIFSNPLPFQTKKNQRRYKIRNGGTCPNAGIQKFV